MVLLRRKLNCYTWNRGISNSMDFDQPLDNQEQKVTEDARAYAEQDAGAQRYATEVIQEKHEMAAASRAEMENRAVMKETMLEATLQYRSGETKAQTSPRSTKQNSSVIRTSQEYTQERIVVIDTGLVNSQRVLQAPKQST